jgi:hypothetical protein
MRRSPALPAAALLAVTILACGETTSKVKDSSSPATSAAGSTTASSRAAPSGGYLRIDGDQDDDDRAHASPAVNDDRELFETYGKSASPADTRAVRKLVQSYYAAALAADGATACSLLHANLAANLAHAAGPDPRKSSRESAREACVRFMSTLLAQQHQRLADGVPTMLVTSVHVKGDVGLAVLGFRSMPEAEIAVEREGHQWKVDALLDSDVT